MSRYTSISVTPEMREQLHSMKRAGETYTELLQRTLKESGR